MKTSMRTERTRRGLAAETLRAACLAGLALALQSCQVEEQQEQRAGGRRFTPLMQAAFKGDLDQVRLLVEAGADVDGRSGDGRRPLMVAAFGPRPEHTAIVEFLVQAGASLDARDHFSGWTALMVASALGNVASAEALIEAGADIDIQDDDDLTAFHIASLAAQETLNSVRQARFADIADILSQTSVDPDLDSVLVDRPHGLYRHHSYGEWKRLLRIYHIAEAVREVKMMETERR